MFVTWACPACDETFKKKNCLGDGKYCASQHNVRSKMTGIQVLNEDIRQYCIYDLAKQGKLEGYKNNRGIFSGL